MEFTKEMSNEKLTLLVRNLHANGINVWPTHPNKVPKVLGDNAPLIDQERKNKHSDWLDRRLPDGLVNYWLNGDYNQSFCALMPIMGKDGASSAATLLSLDFDRQEDGHIAYDAFWAELEKTEFNINKLVLVKTPSNGFHLWFKVLYRDFASVVARDENSNSLIEMKANRSWCTLPFSTSDKGEYQCDVDPSKFYESLPILTVDDVKMITRAIKALDKSTKVEHKPARQVLDSDANTDTLINRYNASVSILEALESLGYIQTGGDGNDMVYMGHPDDKDPNTDKSVTVFLESNKSIHRAAGDKLFSNGRAVSPFDVMCLLQHNGVVVDAMREIAPVKQEVTYAPSPKSTVGAYKAAREAARKMSTKVIERDVVKDVERYLESENEESEVKDTVDQEGKKENVAGVFVSSDGVFVHKKLSYLRSVPPPPALIKKLFCRGEYGFIYGDTGAGKTFLTIDLLVSAMTGRPFAGKFEIPEKLNVAYCANEGQGGLTRRFLAAIDGLSEEEQAEVDQRLTIINVPSLVGGAKSNITAFIRSIEESGEKPDIIVFDIFSKAIAGADENQAKEMSTALDNTEKLAKELDCLVLLIHHTGKNGEFRGSSLFNRNTDIFIRADYDKSHYEKTGEKICSLKFEKLKDKEPAKKVYAKLEVVTGYDGETTCVAEWSDNLIEEDTATNAVKMKEIDTRILAALKGGLKITSLELAKLLDKPTGTIRPALARLEAIGKISKLPEKDAFPETHAKSKQNVYFSVDFASVIAVVTDEYD